MSEKDKRVRVEGRVRRRPPEKWYAMALLSAASLSGHNGTIRLAAQLADAEPCEGCGFVWNHCRCMPNTALSGWPGKDETEMKK